MNASTGVPNVSLTVEEYEYQEFLRDDVLVVGFLAVLCVIGTVGNGHALVVYYLSYKPSNHRTFVLWLAAVDFVACAVSIPFEIVDIRHGYTFGSSEACKFFRYINHVVNIGSGCLFGVIAVERYRKACCPFGRQMSQKESMISCMVTIGASLVISLSCFYIYEAAPKRIDGTNLVGMDCTNGKDKKKESFFGLYSGFLLLLSTIVFILCMVMYILIGKAMYRQMSFRKSTQTLGKSKTQLQKNISSDLSKSSSLPKKITNEIAGNGHTDTQSNAIQTEESSVGLDDNRKVRFVNSNDSSAPGVKLRNGAVKLDRTKRITLMFLVATAVSYVGIIPNIIILIIKNMNKPAYRRLDDQLGIFTPVLLRWYFLSNVTNPVVYCFVDDRFRTECNRLYRNFKTVLTMKRSTVV